MSRLDNSASDFSPPAKAALHHWLSGAQREKQRARRNERWSADVSDKAGWRGERAPRWRDWRTAADARRRQAFMRQDKSEAASGGVRLEHNKTQISTLRKKERGKRVGVGGDPREMETRTERVPYLAD